MGDDVYLYMTAPIQAILYKCEVTETDIPYTFEDGNIKISRAMKIRLIETFDPSFLPVGRLKTHGVSSVRSPGGCRPVSGMSWMSGGTMNIMEKE